MKIIDTYNNIFSAYKNNSFKKELWDNYAVSVFPGLKDKVEKDFAKIAEYKDKIYTILNDVPKNMETMEKVHQSFLKATNDLANEIKKKFNTDLDVTIILYLGLGNGAGWATTVNKQQVVLIGVEKIVELGWCNEKDIKALIYHELGHIYHFHFEHKELSLTKEKQSIQQLYREGIAMVFEQILCDDTDFFIKIKTDG